MISLKVQFWCLGFLAFSWQWSQYTQLIKHTSIHLLTLTIKRDHDHTKETNIR